MTVKTKLFTADQSMASSTFTLSFVLFLTFLLAVWNLVSTFSNSSVLSVTRERDSIVNVTLDSENGSRTLLFHHRNGLQSNISIPDNDAIVVKTVTTTDNSSASLLDVEYSNGDYNSLLLRSKDLLQNASLILNESILSLEVTRENSYKTVSAVTLPSQQSAQINASYSSSNLSIHLSSGQSHSSTRLTIPAFTCPPQYTLFTFDAITTCWKYFDQVQSYSKATEICANDNAALVTLLSHEMYVKASSLVTLPSGIFLPYYQTSETNNVNNYRWEQGYGNIIGYAGWSASAGDPNNDHEQISVLYHGNDGGQWYDVTEANKRGFICERNMMTVVNSKPYKLSLQLRYDSGSFPNFVKVIQHGKRFYGPGGGMLISNGLISFQARGPFDEIAGYYVEAQAICTGANSLVLGFKSNNLDSSSTVNGVCNSGSCFATSFSTPVNNEEVKFLSVEAETLASCTVTLTRSFYPVEVT